MRIGGIDSVRVILKGMIVFVIDSFFMLSNLSSNYKFKIVESNNAIN
jgi:hypothetical protein